jgi:nucleoside-diphosphate kinase
MSGQITFTMIKPDAVADGHIGAILGKLQKQDLRSKQ